MSALEQEIARLLGADPVCCGRVTADTVAAIAALRPTSGMEELRELSEKATEGPWAIQPYYTREGTPEEIVRGMLVDADTDFPIGIIDEDDGTAESLSPNLEFIVAACNHVRAALDGRERA